MRLITTIALALLGLTTWAQTSLPDLPAGAQRYSQTLWIVPSDSTLWTGLSGNYAQVATREQLRQLASQGYTKAQVDSAIVANAPDLTAFYTKLQTDALLNDKADASDLVGVLKVGDNVSDLVNDVPYLTSGDIPAPPVTSVNSMTGAVVVSKSDIGLGNVDNTSDANKPISTATQGALDGKEDAFSKGSLVAGTGVTLDGALANRLVGSGNVTINSTSSLTASNGLQINSGVISPVYGTAAGTVAQGNDSRINNGQTAFGWGNHEGKYLSLGTSTNTNGLFQTIDLDDLPLGNYVVSVDASAPNSPISTPRSLLRIRGSHTNSVSDLLIGATGAAFRNSQTGVWRELWHSSNFNPSDYLLTSTRGVANGVASLDGSGKVPSSQLPTGGMQYQGTWNASTNTPTLSNATGTDGHFYRVTTAGTQNLGSGNITFSVGDDVIHNGSVWQRAPSGTTATNLALGTRTATTMPITNSNGTGFTIPAATTSLAGLMSGADKVKLNAALTDYTETDPTVPSHVKGITSGQISNWNTAYDRGDFRDYGLGTNASIVTGTAMWDEIRPTQFIRSTSAENSPFSWSGVALNMQYNSSNSAQLFIGTGSASSGVVMQFRQTVGPDTWGNVNTVWHDGNFTPSNYLLTSNFTWSNLSGKPSTFAPSPHSHSAADINSGTLAADRIGNATVSNAKLANMSANTIKGRSGSTGAPQDLTAAQVRAILNVQDGAQANVATNLAVGTRTATTVPVTSSTGTSASLPAATTSLAGVMSAADKTKLNGIETGATANATNAQLRDRATHTGTQAISTVSGLQAALDAKATSGTAGSQVRTNTQLDARYIQSIGAGSGISVSGTTVSVDNTVVRTSGNQSISGNKTFNSPTVAPQYQGASTTASSSIPTNAQSLFKATINSNTNYTLTNLTGNPRQIQVMVTNTSGATVYVNFTGGVIRMADGASDSVPSSATVIFTFLIENGTAWGVKSTFL